MALFRRRPPPKPADTTHPYPWFSASDPVTVARGMPEPYEWWQRRPISPAQTVMQPREWFFHSRAYSRGADAYAPQFGIVPTNPIGGAVVSTARMPTIAGPGARYQFGALFFDVQDVPTSVQINPTVPVSVVDALIANAHVGDFYATEG